jgi:hypothetical protein
MSVVCADDKSTARLELGEAMLTKWHVVGLSRYCAEKAIRSPEIAKAQEPEIGTSK